MCVLSPVSSRISFQIVHRALAAMLGSLVALAALAVMGDVSWTHRGKGCPRVQFPLQGAQGLDVSWCLSFFYTLLARVPPGAT